MANFSALKTAIQNAIKQNGNEEITGDVLQQILLSIVSTMGDGAINTIEQNLSNETTTRQGADTQLQNAINAIKANIDNGYVYAGIATPSTTPVSGKVFYIATAAGTYTNFGGQVLTQGINILRFNSSTWSNQQLIGIDDVPTVASNSLVKSGGVQNELALGAVYDVSAKNPTAGPNNDGKWESLSALLSDANLNTLIPTAYRKGGMSIKFVQSSDNKYVQARLMANTFTTDITQWQKVDNEPIPYSKNLIESGGVARFLPNIENSIFTNPIDGRYYNQDGSIGKYTPDNCKGQTIDLSDKIGETITVFLGTQQLAYICIMSENTVLRAYQSMSEPLIFTVTSEMTELRAGGFAMDGVQDVYIKSIVDVENYVQDNINGLNIQNSTSINKKKELTISLKKGGINGSTLSTLKIPSANFNQAGLIDADTIYNLQKKVSIFTNPIVGRYYNQDGSIGIYTPDNCKGQVIDLTDKIGETITVILGTESLAYICIMSGNTVLRSYQSMDEPLIFTVTSEMTELRAGGYVMDGVQDVYIIEQYNFEEINKLYGILENDLKTENSIFTNPIDGRYYNQDGSIGTYTPDNCKGQTIDLTDKIGQTITVFLGTEGLAYICIMSGNTVLRAYQSMDEPLIFTVTSEMTELRAGGYVMDGVQDVYNGYEIESLNEFINDKIEQSKETKYKGSLMVTFGDSITAGYNTTKKWGDIVSTKLKTTYINYAISGSQITNIINQVNNAAQNASLVFAWGGTNDWALGNIPLGDMYSVNTGTKVINTDTTTFYGRVASLCIALLNKYPTADIYIITPLHRSTYKEQYANDLTPNSVGKYLGEYVQAIIDVCAYYSINVINAWADSGMNPNIQSIASAYFNHQDGGLPDLLHPDANGHERIAEMVIHNIL